MNFLSAIKHAAIDYGIRREAWHMDAVLALDGDTIVGGCYLHWIDEQVKDGELRSDPCNGPPVRLCGPDPTYDLTPEDIAATDWEVI